MIDVRQAVIEEVEAMNVVQLGRPQIPIQESQLDSTLTTTSLSSILLVYCIVLDEQWRGECKNMVSAVEADSRLSWRKVS